MAAIVDRAEAFRRLGRAEEVKTVRRELRLGLKDRSITLADALERARANPDCHRMAVVQLLRSMSYVGPTKIGRTLRLAGMSADKKVGALTDRQAEILVGALDRD